MIDVANLVDIALLLHFIKIAIIVDIINTGDVAP